jgi:hypothetical protein
MELLAKVGEQVLLAVLPLLAVALAGWLVAQGKLAWVRAKEYAPNLMGALAEAAAFAVQAAEQSKLAGLIVDKKAEALTVAELYLQSLGFKVDLHLIDAAIEKAVFEAFPQDCSGPAGFPK